MLIKKIEDEIRSYTEDNTEIFEGVKYSQYKLIKRIVNYESQNYPKGKLDSHNRYKYWFDIISPRVDSEIKNIDFDTKDIRVYSESDNDSVRVLIANAYLRKWLKDTKQSEKINDAVELGSSWGNVVWKKIKGDYEIADLRNLYVINQTAKSLNDTAVIERHEMTQAELRSKDGVWKNVSEVIKSCGSDEFSATKDSEKKGSKSPVYEIYERNGEISEQDLFEAQGKSGGNPDKYFLAKIVAAGLNKNSEKTGDKYFLYAEPIDEMPYKEYHRGRYQGRWFRTGIIELLMDVQTRSNEIGNQIAQGLEWASKSIFRSSDKVIAQNLLDDLTNGDIIRSADLQQVQIRMQGLDQLIADWNRLMQIADRLTNSHEVIVGEALPSGTPFRLGAMLNQNANKLFDFIREKLAISLSSLIEDWILPYLLKDLKAEEIVRITGDDDMLRRYYEILINSWYTRNLIVIGPHTEEEAQTLKDIKMQELLKNKEALVSLRREFWNNFKPRIQVDITGERVALAAELESYANFINLELDPVRRTALIELAMKKRGIDTEKLPKSPPQPAPMPNATQMAQGPQGVQAQSPRQ